MGYNKDKDNPNFKYHIDKQFLIKEYSINKNSMIKIAKLVGCCWMTIKRYLLKYNIRIRTYKEINLGKNNGIWRGDNVSYSALHGWIQRHKPKPKYCEDCNLNPPRELANISQEYKRDINDFKWLCRSCHTKMDYDLNVRKGKRHELSVREL